MSGANDSERDGIPSIRPWAISVDDPDYEFDRAATTKMPARPHPRRSLLRVAGWGMLGGATFATAFLVAFGDHLAPSRQASRAVLVPVATPQTPVPVVSIESLPATQEPQIVERSAQEQCEAALQSSAPVGTPHTPGLCAWLVAHAEGRAVGPAPIAAVRAVLAREGARKIAGRVVRDALDPGVVQITSSGVWGYCLRATSIPAPGPDGAFWMWIRRTSDQASVEVGPGRVQACVLLEEAPVAEMSDLATMPAGPAATEVATRVLASLGSSR